jgi:hypothetical protein
MMLASLLVAATERNEAKPDRLKILAAVQTDDPKFPGMIKIDVDHPNDSEKMAIKNRYVCRLMIDSKTGEMEFSPNGYLPSEKHQLAAAPLILERMIKAIESH